MLIQYQYVTGLVPIPNTTKQGWKRNPYSQVEMNNFETLVTGQYVLPNHSGEHLTSIQNTNIIFEETSASEWQIFLFTTN